ncbi:MAG: spore germination protein GerW family protein [Acidimicrobiales bacterium]
MSDDTSNDRHDTLTAALDRLGAVRDSMHVSRVFGEAYEVDGTTIIPVATLKGGGGGGGGEGSTPDEAGTGSGAGVGFGVQVRPVGVYEIRGGLVTWHPAVDTMRVILGGQILGMIALVLLLRRARR